MTPRELMAYFENYYGEKYTGAFQEAMFDYLSDCKKEFLTAICKVIVLRYSRSHNKSPDPAIIEKNIEEIFKVMNNFKIIKALPEPIVERCSEEEMKELEACYQNILKRQ